MKSLTSPMLQPDSRGRVIGRFLIKEMGFIYLNTLEPNDAGYRI